ncbi:MAG: TonB-dependent receptor plug domain-containing protein, partial [Pyrinomonadaceae bacterium]
MKRRKFLLLVLAVFGISATAARSNAAYPVQNVGSLIFRGTVVDQNSAPITGANIALRKNNREVAKSTSDSNGNFSIVYSGPEKLTLVVTAEGFAPYALPLKHNYQSQVTITLQPAPVVADVTVAASRTPMKATETATKVIAIDQKQLAATAAVTLDDALRQVAGFSLFRRSGSRTANPTSQGVSLRGLGASGASRALVLADGVPLNDPFGGWVYWNRVPRESIEAVEVVLGGASHLYGSTALGGVVAIQTKQAEVKTLALTAAFGNENTPNASLYLSGEKNNWAASVAAETFRTNGYVLVPQRERGLIDTPAASRNAVLTLRVARQLGDRARAFSSASFFGESRANGTPLQTNRTHLRQFVLGGDVQPVNAGAFSARIYGG